MDTFFDIKALPNPEIIQVDVVAALMQKLHLILPKFDGRVALDFPAYRYTLGGIIRLLGTKQDIEELHSQINTINLFTDYALIEEVDKIPADVKKYVRNKRRHADGGNSRLRRLEKYHKAKGTWTSKHEHAKTVKQHYNTAIRTPHLNIKSLSTKKTFKLFILRLNSDKLSEGRFNSYGLSVDNNGSIPKF